MAQKIFVGLSGGVDSAVSAALLKERGYRVVGCFIKIWQPEFIECTWREDRLDAMRVAAKLAIPFKEIDLSEEYKREVVDKMTADYARGITPNPDVLCNTSIKFGHFLKWALSEGADGVGTGHYARAVHEHGATRLFRGKDTGKDQSYFLWQLGQHELGRTFFPVGELEKSKVRALAKKYGLPNADKPDSQGLCFVGDTRMEDFLRRFLTLAPGPVRSVEGEVIGEHEGAALYTPGQRHGFTLKKGAQPHYVVSVNIKENSLVASPDRSETLCTRAEAEEVHWIHKPPLPLEAEVQARYRERPAKARIFPRGEGIAVEFFEPHLVSPGQSLVVYQNDECLGGGVIGIGKMR